MSSLNKVQIIGNLGADPEVRTFQTGGKVCNLRVACSETWKDKNTGERREKTEWFTVAIFQEGLVRVAEQYLKKGSKVYIEGKLQTGDVAPDKLLAACFKSFYGFMFLYLKGILEIEFKKNY